MRMKYFLIVLFVAVTIVACQQKKQINEPVVSQWLFPLIKGNLSMNDVTRLEGKVFQYTIQPSDIGFSTQTPINSPELFIDQIGPFAIPIDPIIHHLDIDSLEIALSFENLFPVTLDAGFMITLRQSRDTVSSQNIIWQQTFTQALQPNTTDSIQVHIHQAHLTDSIYFSIQQLHIDAFEQIVFDDPINISCRIQKLRISELGLYSGKELHIQDTVSFNGNDINDLITQSEQWTDSTSNGHLNFYFDNGIPVCTAFQMYFLQNHVVIDSLFDQGLLISGAGVDGSGNVNQILQQQNSIFLSTQKLKRIQPCNQLIYNFYLHTLQYSIPVVLLHPNNVMQLQIVGDFSLTLQPFN